MCVCVCVCVADDIPDILDMSYIYNQFHIALVIYILVY